MSLVLYVLAAAIIWSLPGRAAGTPTPLSVTWATSPALRTRPGSPGVELTVSLSDAAGSVTRVSFLLVSGRILAAVTPTGPSAAYHWAPPPGAYRVRARATDDRSHVALSPVLTVTAPG